MEMPTALQSELTKMRRNPTNFTIPKRVKCKFCTEKESAYHLLNANSEFAVGSWCPIHGWLFFDSVKVPPTERLTATEVAERQLEQRRKRGPRK